MGAAAADGDQEGSTPINRTYSGRVEPANDPTPSTLSRNISGRGKRKVPARCSWPSPFLATYMGGDRRGADFEFTPHAHHKRDADDDARQRIRRSRATILKSTNPGKVSLASARPQNYTSGTAKGRCRNQSDGTRAAVSGIGCPSMRHRPFSTRTRPSATSLSANG